MLTLALSRRNAEEIDFVWGATESHIASWRASVNPDVVLAKYIPYTRDPAPRPGANTNLPWWQAHHPSLVLYTADRKTPAWECFAGEGCAHVSVPLDLTNPATLAYQIENAVAPAAAAGYSAIALDNYGVRNAWNASGAWKGPHGEWVELYASKDDARYTRDVLNWTARAVDAIHAHGLLVIPNYGEENLTDPSVSSVVALVDGVLREGGFTHWNPIPNSSSFKTPPLKTTPSRFAQDVAFARQLQRRGKAIYTINEWGAGPDFGLNPSKVPYNISAAYGGAAHANRAIRQFVVATYMIINGGASGIFLTCVQCYGGNAGGVGGLSLWPEYTAAVGSALEEAAVNAQSGVWHRAYTGGLALVNPTAQSQSYALPAGCDWSDLYGGDVPPGALELAPASGLVLTRSHRRQ